MKNALKVFRRDLKGMLKNPITMMIIGGLCIVPSLYAFLNVIGCWDAYSNTSEIPIAVVNEDTGATLEGKTLNIGNSIVQSLKGNETINWRFVNAQEANIGIASGKYFSELIIPSNFSKDLATLDTNNPIKPELVYRVNTKAGPVANKITEVAQQTVLAQVQSSIMSSLSQQAFSKFNTYGAKAKDNVSQIISLKNSIISLNNNMNKVLNGLNNVSTNSGDLNSYLTTLKSTIPVVNTSLLQIESNTQNIGQVISSTKGVLDTSLNNMELNLNESKSMMQGMENTASNLVSDSDSKSSLNEMNKNIDFVQSSIGTDLKFLNGIDKGSNNSQIQSLIQSLNNANDSLTTQKQNVQNAFNSGNNLSNSTISLIQSSTNTATSAIDDALAIYENGGKGAINNICDALISSTNSATNLINNTEGLNTKIQNVLVNASSGAMSAKQASESLSNYLNQYKGIISNLSSKLQNVSDNNINEIIALLQGNPIVMSNFTSQPFNFKQESICPVANYGSGMAPVYSVLAFWVGMLLTGSLIKPEIRDFEGSEKMTIREKYYGKMLTYAFIAIIQSLVITLGDRFLVGVQVDNLPLFVLGSLVTSITFAIIIYTILGIFGHIGDAICVVLMVVQLSGTGGTYPVQAMPLFFRVIEPFVPFPYGVDMMRQAIGGVYWPNAIKDIVILVLFAIVALLVGYFIEPKAHNIFKKFEEKFRESRIAE